jgi:nicotinate-nucleotide pyrophosphorylase (carboxylating)
MTTGALSAIPATAQALPLPLHPLQYEPVVRQALEEDLGRAGDITTNAIIPPEVQASGRLVARKAGCIAGLEVAACTIRMVAPDVDLTFLCHDGEVVQAGQTLAEVQGQARAILTAERVALNFLGGRCHGNASAGASGTWLSHAGGLYAQDHAGLTHPGKICRTRWWWGEPPFWAGRRRTH